MPNQHSWMLRWVLSVVFPRLIPRHILDSMRVIISDGDPQEYSQIDNAIAKYFPNVYRMRCGWHIIAKGFEKHIDTTFPDLPQDVVSQHMRIIQNWCYSWMKIDCETYLQFKYSYYLLCKYLYSPKIVSLFGIVFSNNVTMFLRRNVFTWEKWFLYCHRTKIKHYGEYTNNPLEGTNNMLKHATIKVHPQLRLDNSFQILNDQSKKKIHNIRQKVIKNCMKVNINKRTDEWIIFSQLTNSAAEIVRNLMYMTSKYECIRVTHDSWKVTRRIETFKKIEERPIPIFRQCYNLKVCVKNKLRCDYQIMHKFNGIKNLME